MALMPGLKKEIIFLLPKMAKGEETKDDVIASMGWKNFIC